MGPFGWKEILIILLIVLVLFGAKKLPELARGMGKSIKEFKKATTEEEEEEAKEAEKAKADTARPSPAAAAAPKGNDVPSKN